MQNTRNILVIGAGFSGAVVARELAEKNYTVTVIDRRHHVAGNAFDFVNKYGIRVHKYGPHLFHTSNMKVVEWLSRFCQWIPYRHKVKAMLPDGQLVTLPVNAETSQIVGKENVIDTFFRPYTKKMWGLKLDEIDPEIVNRVPIREDMNEFYFPNDIFQALPRGGYTQLVERILDHENINVSLNTEFHPSMCTGKFHIFNSMSIDEFFSYKFGRLSYRSIKFHTFDIPVPHAYPVATINFTHEQPYTRVTEWKNLPDHGNCPDFTSLTIEEPCNDFDNNYERYYPVKDIKGINLLLYKRYANLTPPNMTFIGRCGLYAYLDMHQAINSAISTSKKFIESNRP